eukprot:CAMPEP_0177788258 /NCGR_PEP_ID=MMETSP0491_2-20121128/22002_1 /TAXON_ID=63592 /ORGANISM="Tetraselmis chuii, Strain PLY429" /LENGTH=236 /DNA_ID=CAMNT_0019309807 /DNA_START=42 /DNA_END=752 /DNA_ORIENTATION=+
MNWGLLAAGTAAASLAALAVHYGRLERESFPARTVEATCHCGRFAARVRLPLEVTPSAACCCHDCIDFAVWMEDVKRSPVKVLHDRAVKMVQIFKKDMEVLRGGELIQRAQLRSDSQLLRFYASCCGTPIGLSPNLTSYPIIICYAQIFGENAQLLGPHTWTLFVSRQYPDPKTMPSSLTLDGAAVCSDTVGPAFLGRVVVRVLYGMLVGKGRPSPIQAFSNQSVEIVKPTKASYK